MIALNLVVFSNYYCVNMLVSVSCPVFAPVLVLHRL